MGDIERRIQDLERLVQPPEDEGAQLRRAIMTDILDEVARLKSSRAVHYRGGTPPMPIEPEDIPGKILGPGYTTGDMWELAVRRVFERERESSPDILSEEIVERMVEGWTASFRRSFVESGHDWNKVEG